MIQSHQRRQSLRKIAILIQSLDEEQSDRLLEQMSLEQAADVREMAETLNDVDEDERALIIDEFLRASGRTNAPANKGSAVELELSGAARATSSSRPNSLDRNEPSDRGPLPIDNGRIQERAIRTSIETTGGNSAESSAASSHRPLGFVRANHSPAVAQWVLMERESVGVVVLSLLEPVVAARVLEELPFERQKTLLTRLAELRKVEPEVIQELERVLRLVVDDLPEETGATTGHAAVRAILDQVQAAHRARLIPEPRSEVVEFRLPAQAQATPRTPSRLSPSPSPSPMSAPQRKEIPGQPHLKLVANEEAGAPVRAASASTAVQPRPIGMQEQQEIAARFEELSSWTEAELVSLLKRIPPRMVKLALVGSSQALVSKVLRPLQRDEASRWKEMIERPGAIRVADIAAAQLAILKAAEALLRSEESRRSESKKKR